MGDNEFQRAALITLHVSPWEYEFLRGAVDSVMQAAMDEALASDLTSSQWDFVTALTELADYLEEPEERP